MAKNSTPIPNQMNRALILLKSYADSLMYTAIFVLGLAGVANVSAQSIDLAQSPLLALKSAPGLVMLTMGRDLPLYKAAYNDVNDLNGDGIPDIYFMPAFKYEGYFAHDRCYNYAAGVFTPASVGTAVQVDPNDRTLDYYTCAGNWSGNFLNWVTMARIDVLRKVLYGGKRSIDTVNAAGVGTTVLERTYVPQDSTIWGKEYTSIAVDGYDIRLFTNLQLPTVNLKHMFANTTLASAGLNGAPLMFVYANRSGRIWSLVAQEAIILGANPTTATTASSTRDPEPSATRGTVTPYTVRVQTCVPLVINGNIVYERMCTGYPKNAPTTYKPTGLLHTYGEAKTLAFGLISGTYDNNYAGGVLRQNVDDFDQEVNAINGTYTAVQGVVYHLNQFKPLGFSTTAQWNCGSWTGLPANGNCPAWGNPLGEMMFEGIQYFAGGTPTPAFVGNGTEPIANSVANALGLRQPAWRNPYAASASRAHTAAYPSCARPIQMTIGDPKTSFDSDHLPGAAFAVGANMGANSTPALSTLNVSTEADAIWNSEFGVAAARSFFIGEVLGNKDGNPTSKAATSFRNIRGHGPDATTNEGSFYGASVARYAKFTGISNPALPNTILRANQISIALDSHIPKIQIPLGGQTVSIVLLSKSVGDTFGGGVTNARNAYQITGSITGFFIDQMVNTNASNMNLAVNAGRPYYKFRISFSDADQGNDNESDAKVTYEIRVLSGNTLSVGMDYFEGSNGIEMHQGYVISGTTNDGVYLDVGGAAGFRGPTYGNAMLAPTIGYFLDTRPTLLPGSAMAAPATGPAFTNIAARLPITTLAAPRVFTVGNNPAAGQYVPHDMLWYAAKYGGAELNADGSFRNFKLKTNNVDPDSYYFVNNPSKLSEQLGQAFQKAASLSLAISTAVASSGVKVSGGNLVYQASFDSIRWGGDVRAFEVQADGNISNTAKWESNLVQPAPTARNVVLGQATAVDPKLKSASINASSFTSLGTVGPATFTDNATFQYLLGDRSREQGTASGTLRQRNSAVGDIVNSDPLYIGKSDFGYTDTTYKAFKDTSDPKLIAVGSNDGFYRLISADTGVEKLAFIPAAIAGGMINLANPNYTHRYFVDGPSAFGHVKFGTTVAAPEWAAVVAGTLGAGGKAVFALNASAANLTDNSAVLWEVNENNTDAGDRIGNILNKPVVGSLNGISSTPNAPVVLVGNGANSGLNKASLLVLNAKTGKSIATCTPTDAANTLGNGMTSIAAVSEGNDGNIDIVYAADYKGNIWRINPNSDSLCGTGAKKIFTAKDSTGKLQPITGDLTVITAPSPKTGYVILFGTGKLSGVGDAANKDVQTMYGVWDENKTSSTLNASRADLIDYPFAAFNTAQQTRAVPKQASINGGKAWYETSDKKGWMIDLKCSGCPDGERFIDKPLVAGKASAPVVYFLSHTPGDDACKVGGDGWVTGIDPNTGAFVKAFTKLENSNSVSVPGAAPRGLYIVTTPSSGSTPGKEYIYVSVNGDPGTPKGDSDSSSESTDFNDKNGLKTCVGATCIGGKGKEITPDPDTVPVLGKRLVWRQIQ